MHSFSYETGGLRVWKAFQVGPGKLITWNDIYVSHQSATDIMFEDNFASVWQKIHENSWDSDDTESIDEPPVFQWQDPGCARTFNSLEDVELHVSIGQHTENVYDILKRGDAVKFSSLTIEGETATSTETESCTASSSSFSNLSRVGLFTSWKEERFDSQTK